MINYLSKSVSCSLAFLTVISPLLYAAEDFTGVVAISEKNCVACHSPSDAQAQWISPNTAPRLTNIGSRVSADWLQRYLAAPHEVTPGTAMPDQLHGNEEQSETLTHYLISLGKTDFQRVVPDRGAVARGENLYHQVGCIACHAPLNGAAAAPGSQLLPVMQEKWAFEGLKQFLIDPLAIRPSGRMPGMHLTATEAADIAHYLLRETNLPATAEVAFYQSRIRSFANLDTVALARTYPIKSLALEGPMREPKSAFRITTWLDVKSAGSYTFFLKATGASRLSVAGRWVLGEESWDNEKVDDNFSVVLPVGRTEIKLDYVHRGAEEPAMELQWSGLEMTRQAIPVALLSNQQDPATKLMAELPVLQLDPIKVAQGLQLYNSLNCATCHDGKSPEKSLPSLAAMDLSRGCLAEIPAGIAPNFHLDPPARETLRKALAQANTPPPEPKQRVALTMNSLRCVACHVRDDYGGILPERAAFFTSNVDDLGDQGRIPPNLSGVGDKLRPEWLNKVFAEGASVRPYLNTRMPKFGAANVGHMTELFVSLDRHAQPLAAVADLPEVQKEVGRSIVGIKGLSCIGCHKFNGQAAHSMQVLDLTTTTGRLNEDWFRRLLRNPNTFQPGTRMPSLWPNGQSLLPTLLDGDTDRQHAALWTYLADGSKAKSPDGLTRKFMEIVVSNEAVVYRGKLWEAGFRAVATAYPGQLNVAFDSEEMRLAAVWRGRFLDASAHWSNQGMGSIHPLGSDVVLFPHGSAFATLADAKSPWPSETSKTLGMKFHGYQLDSAKRPLLSYTFGNLNIEDFTSSTDLPSLQRSLKFSGEIPTGLYFRLAMGKLVSTGDHTWRLNDELTISLKRHSNAFIRGKGEQMELLVPISPTTSNSALEIDYVW
jgi:mono/diheme cytochrome c family protein